MGRKRKKHQKPFCWYCDRVFDDEKILIQHQKAKHFKCHVCHKKLTTAGGMVVHVFQVHKENITKVPNSKPGRDSVKYEIYGMDGIPDEEDEQDEKKQKTESAAILPSTLGSTTATPTKPPILTSTPPITTATATTAASSTPATSVHYSPVPLMIPQPAYPVPYPRMGYGPWTRVPPHPLVQPLGAPQQPTPPQWSTNSTMARQASPYAVQPGGPLANQAVYPNSLIPVPQPMFPAYHTRLPTGITQQTQPLQQTQKPNQYLLIYEDSDLSMEEKRAELEKYHYDEEKIKAEVHKLDQTIESRLSSMGNFIGKI